MEVSLSSTGPIWIGFQVAVNLDAPIGSSGSSARPTAAEPKLTANPATLPATRASLTVRFVIEALPPPPLVVTLGRSPEESPCATVARMVGLAQVAVKSRRRP